MTKEENKATELLLVAEALNKGNLSVVDGYLAPDFTYHGPTGDVKGVTNYKKFLSILRTAYPDIHVDVKDIVAEGDLVATRTFCTFTFTNNNNAVAPKKKITMTGAILDRFEGNKIAETWEHYDRLDLNQQLGILSYKRVSA
jgi:predicted ester cyclase